MYKSLMILRLSFTFPCQLNVYTFLYSSTLYVPSGFRSHSTFGSSGLCTSDVFYQDDLYMVVFLQTTIFMDNESGNVVFIRVLSYLNESRLNLNNYTYLYTFSTIWNLKLT